MLSLPAPIRLSPTDFILNRHTLNWIDMRQKQGQLSFKGKEANGFIYFFKKFINSFPSCISNAFSVP